MTEDRHQLERSLRDLYDDAPALPDRVLAKALEDAAGTNQRRWGWLPLGRARGGQRRSPLFVPLAAVLVVAVLAVGLVGLLLSRPDPTLLAPAASVVPDRSSAPSPRPGAQVIVLAADGSGDVTTLEAALARADDGDTIVIGPGTYIGGVTVGKDLHIRGDGPREEVVVIATGETPTVELDDTVSYAFLTQGSDAVIAGLTLRNAGARAFAPIVAVGGAPTLEGLDAGGTIWLTDASAAVVRDNRLDGLALTGALGNPVTEDNVMAPARSVIEQSLAERMPSLDCEPWREVDEPFMFGATAAVRCPAPVEGATQLALFAFPDVATLERFWQWRLDALDLPLEQTGATCADGVPGAETWSLGSVACYRGGEVRDIAKIRWTLVPDGAYGVLDGIDSDVASLHHSWQQLVDQ